MSSSCRCSVCGRPTDCGDEMCAVCECQQIGNKYIEQKKEEQSEATKPQTVLIPKDRLVSN